MKRIFKYSFEVSDKEQHGPWYWPNGLTPFVAMQGDFVCLWQTVPDLAVEEIGIFKVVGTGYEFDDVWRRIGTAIDPRGFVWHLLLKRQ